ncbi:MULTISPECIES: hypothetical protein [unclassified Stenotrophomonas]|uniref:hypothetical protein n=1 Tax=unclassified Stenotrophomonas TaxID=196198 RepID=UPI0011B2078A|nr:MULTISPECIES: hypothetical protein [unclassified Stenotrophomonas]
MSLFIAGSPWLQRRSYRGSSFAQRLLNAGQPAMKCVLTCLNGSLNLQLHELSCKFMLLCSDDYHKKERLMRSSTEKEFAALRAFNDELAEMARANPLQQVDETSKPLLQIIAYHLIFEFLIEKWIDHAINEGNSTFRGIEKIGFHNKLYLAKNLGFPMDLFHVLDQINNERNQLAHKIDKKPWSRKELMKLGESADKLGHNGSSLAELRLSNGKTTASGAELTEGELLYLVLAAIYGKLHNFVFTDVHNRLSSPLR